MKKFLSLVLALVMTMSLVTISAGAKDFTDDDKIQYEEAIDVVSTVKIVDGYADGSFNPQATLTRGAAAKIICNMILGPTTASALVADAAPYKDVPADSTFAGYIAYCQKEGIISGYADGTFKPGNSLTGYAFMKMLLGALGYDADVEGYTGANWSINVAKRALNVGLDKGLVDSFNGVKAVTREEACLYAFNTLKATMVTYDAKTTVSVGDAEVVVGGSAVKEVTTNNDTNKISADGKVQFAEKYFSKLKKTNKSQDDFGRPATEWKYKTESIGTYVNKGDLVATYTKKVTKDDMYTLLGKSVYDDLSKSNADLHVYTNGIGVVSPVVDSYIKKGQSGASNDTDNGILTEVYVDGDNNTTIVSIPTYLVKAAADYSTKKESVTVNFVTDNGSSTPTGFPATVVLKQEDFDVADVKEDDYLLITTAKVNGTWVVKSVTPAETVTGAVETYTNKSSVTIGGTKYKYNAIVGTSHKNSSFSIGEEAVLVLDTYGYVMMIDDAIVANDFVFVNNSASKSGLNTSYVGAAYFTDGTYEEINLKKVKNAAGTEVALSAGMQDWYTFVKNTDGKYTLTELKYGSSDYTKTVVPVAADGLAKNDFIKSGRVAFCSENSSLKANDKTVFVVRDSNNDVTASTGVKNAPSISLNATRTGAVSVTAVSKGGYAKLVFIDLYNDATASINDATTTTDDYMLILDAGTKVTHVTNDKGSYEYKVLKGGEEVKVTLAKDADPLTKGVVYHKVQTNADGYITSARAASLASNVVASGALTVAAAPKYSNGALKFNTTEYILDADSKINLVIDNDDANDDDIGDSYVLVEDKDADYEIYSDISGKSLENILSGLTTLNFTYTVVLDDTASASDTIDTLFVYVISAT